MIFNSRVLRLALPLLASGAAARPLGAQQEPAAAARRIADIAAIAVAEYAEGVRDGRIVQPAEFAEARLFLAEARQTADRLAPEAGAAILPPLARLGAQVEALVPATELERTLTALRAALERVAGEPLDPLPAAAPSLARGEALYQRYCAQCHGEAGAGDGTLVSGLAPPPADLTDTALAAASPADFFRRINVGVAGTSMPAFGDQLALDDRWAVALYASTMRYPKGARVRGRARLRAQCPECLVTVSGFESTAHLSDRQLDSLLAVQLGSQPARDLTAFARAAAAVEEFGADRVLEGARTVARVHTLADDAVQIAERGDGPAAARRALDAYLAFERIERTVRARDAKAAARAERAFAAFRAAVAADRPADWEAARRDVTAALQDATASLTAGTSAASLFGQSLVIMLREGVEAILIIGALVAFLVKAGAAERKRDIGTGVVAALGASLVTAVAFATLFRTAVAHQELLEGLTLLAAAVVLFWVSYWLISKIEVRKWQAFVRLQMQRALASRRAFALAAVAFLAVYREGFETVLFYAALFSTAGGSAGAATAVITGMLVGLALLVALYVGIERYGVRLALRPFFAVTSTLLYVMAFSFAGQGVAELQGAGLISATPLTWLPDVPLLGIFPTIQTLIVQALLALALVAALLWLFWLQPRTDGAAASA